MHFSQQILLYEQEIGGSPWGTINYSFKDHQRIGRQWPQWSKSPPGREQGITSHPVTCGEAAQGLL